MICVSCIYVSALLRCHRVLLFFAVSNSSSLIKGSLSCFDVTFVL